MDRANPSVPSVLSRSIPPTGGLDHRIQDIDPERRGRGKGKRPRFSGVNVPPGMGAKSKEQKHELFRDGRK